MSAPARARGACPSLSAPMQTGDGLLVRLNPLDSALSPRDLLELARAAARFGNGQIEITARGSLQVRGLTPSTAPELAHFVDGLDLAVRDGVPVETAPLAGLDPHEIADPRPLAKAIRDAIAGQGLSARLGPKVSVVIDGGGRSMLDAVKADVRLTAVQQGAGVVWRLALAGDAKGAIAIADVTEAEACAAAIDQLSAIAALGRSARAKDLLPHSSTPPSGLPAISPTRGEISLVAVAPPEPSALLAPTAHPDAASAIEMISPRVGEMSGRTEGGATERKVGELPFGLPIPLTDSRVAIRIALPFGAIDSATLATFAETLTRLGLTDLRLCPERSLLLLCTDTAQATAARHAAHSAGLIVSATDPRLAIVACAGAPACASAHYATKALAEAIATDVAQLLPAGAKLHLSGCDKRCAEPSGPSIALIGREDGCAIVANGTSVPPALSEYLARRGAIPAHDRRAS